MGPHLGGGLNLSSKLWWIFEGFVFVKSNFAFIEVIIEWPLVRLTDSLSVIIGWGLPKPWLPGGKIFNSLFMIRQPISNLYQLALVFQRQGPNYSYQISLPTLTPWKFNTLPLKIYHLRGPKRKPDRLPSWGFLRSGKPFLWNPRVFSSLLANGPKVCRKIDKDGGEKNTWYCWWNWWNKSGVHQLRLVVYPIIYKVLAPSEVVQDFFHQQYGIHNKKPLT